MLGSRTEADDAVQEAWLRLNRSDADEIENLGGWLTTVVARVALNMLRSRATRREEPLEDVHFPDPLIDRADAVDPEHQALLADSVGLALLVVLETLSPAERLAFVLHDMFAVPFDEIGPMVDRSPDRRPPARQPRAPPRAGRRAVARPRPGRAAPRRRRVLRRRPRRRLRGPGRRPAPRRRAARGRGRGRSLVVHGAENVARRAMTFARLAPFVRPALVNGAAGVVVAPKGRPFSVMGFTVTGGRIVAIDALADPERLRALDLTVLD